MTSWRDRDGLLVPGGEGPETPVDAGRVKGSGVNGDGPETLALPVDGYTGRVRDLEAAAAEAGRVRDLPTSRVLDRRQALAEAAELAELDAGEHARRLAAAGERERAELTAQAASAAARRRLEADVDVRALALSRRRRRWSGIAWTVLTLAMAYTAVNVQAFAAAGAPAWSLAWLVAWGVDPLLSALVVGLLLARGDLAVLGLPVTAGRGKRVIYAVEVGALGAVLLMNVSPTLAPGVPWQTVALHVVVPLAGMAAALVLPIVQERYAAAIASLYEGADTDPSGRASGPINLGELGAEWAGEAELSADDRMVLDAVRTALEEGGLTHPPTGYAIYKNVMGMRGDKARAYRVAAALRPRNGHQAALTP